jgi:type VI secretion system protein ImpM
MPGAGIFGKIPSHGDFVSRGTGSEVGRAFERWLQMANERLYEAKAQLPAGPLGFSYRGPVPDAVLVGVMVPSRDRVGRIFPLTLFHEVSATSARGCVFAVPGALADALDVLAQLAAQAPRVSKGDLERHADQAEAPTPAALAHGLAEQRERLHSRPVSTLFERLFPDNRGVYYAMSVLQRACHSAHSNPVSAPVVIDARATSDLELAFWLACAEACLPPRACPPAALWDVAASRVLVAMGSPDSNSLNYLAAGRVQHRKLWDTLGSAPGGDDSAKARLPDRVVDAIEAGGTVSVGEFVSMLAGSDDEAAGAKGS